MRRNNRGAALGLVIVTAAIFAVAAFAALTMALSRAQVATVIGPERLRASYAAEAGLVWAMERLWTTPAWGSPPGNVDLVVPNDMNGDGVIAAGEGVSVDVIFVACGGPPCPDRQLQARVVY